MRDVASVWQTQIYFEEKFGHPLGFDFMGIAWVLSVSRIAAPLAVIALMLLIRRPAVVSIAIVCLWLAFVALPVLNVLRMLNEPFLLPGWMWATFWPLGSGFAFCAAATVYLLRSRRVAATFARRADVARIFD